MLLSQNLQEPLSVSYVRFNFILSGELKTRIEQEYSRINEESIDISSDLYLHDIFPVSDSNVIISFIVRILASWRNSDKRSISESHW